MNKGARLQGGVQGSDGVQVQVGMTAPTDAISTIEAALTAALSSGAFRQSLLAAGGALPSCLDCKQGVVLAFFLAPACKPDAQLLVKDDLGLLQAWGCSCSPELLSF